MDEYDYYDELKKHALDNDNYKNWRKVHKKAFGDLFENAFSQKGICYIVNSEKDKGIYDGMNNGINLAHKLFINYVV